VTIRARTLRDLYNAWRCVSLVAREHDYRGFREIASPKESRRFWTRQIENGHPFLVAIEGPPVIGWADVVPAVRPKRVKFDGRYRD